MIIDIERFIAMETPLWRRLDGQLAAWEADPHGPRSLAEVREVERLYQRASADLARLSSHCADPATVSALEALVGRGYAAIYGGHRKRQRFRFWAWLLGTWPRTFRQHIGAFWLATAAMAVGAGFGAAAMALDERAKPLLIGPFSHLAGDPSERVRMEETTGHTSGSEGTFAGTLMTHNTRVSLLSLSLGMTAGVGTIILLFYNGTILGAVCLDYLRAGEGVFLAGWLLPHGVIEIPAILIASQAGLVLAGALLGGRQPMRMSERLRAVAPAVATLAGAAAVMLVWAGIIEAFFSQRHQPILPYSFKIAFGITEGILLVALLAYGGRPGLRIVRWLQNRKSSRAHAQIR